MSGEDDDYELVARNDLATLRREVEDVKKNPVQNYESSLTLIEAMDHLADQISRLLDLFERANKEMHEDYQQGLHKEAQKLDTVIAQNEKIARGILAIVDKDQSGPSLQQSADSSPQVSSQQGASPAAPQQQNTEEDAQGSYPLRGPEQMREAPWKDDSGHSKSRRSLMKEFR